MKTKHRIKVNGRYFTFQLLGMDELGGTKWRITMGKMTATQVWPGWARIGVMVVTVADAMIAQEKKA